MSKETVTLTTSRLARLSSSLIPELAGATLWLLCTLTSGGCQTLQPAQADYEPDPEVSTALANIKPIVVALDVVERYETGSAYPLADVLDKCFQKPLHLTVFDALKKELERGGHRIALVDDPNADIRISVALKDIRSPSLAKTEKMTTLLGVSYLLFTAPEDVVTLTADISAHDLRSQPAEEAREVREHIPESAWVKVTRIVPVQRPDVATTLSVTGFGTGSGIATVDRLAPAARDALSRLIVALVSGPAVLAALQAVHDPLPPPAHKERTITVHSRYNWLVLASEKSVPAGDKIHANQLTLGGYEIHTSGNAEVAVTFLTDGRIAYWQGVGEITNLLTGETVRLPAK